VCVLEHVENAVAFLHSELQWSVDCTSWVCTTSRGSQSACLVVQSSGWISFGGDRGVPGPCEDWQRR
jgi:hypothetical protein